MSTLENTIRYQFKSKSLLRQALTHSSYANEKSVPDNEVLEFLGDSILGMVVGHMLVEKYPEMNEGELSKSRAQLVNQSNLAELAKKINLGSHILLGNGEKKDSGSQKDSILADTFEALIAAIYKDSGELECITKVLNIIMD